jgi:hypothetical protein
MQLILNLSVELNHCSHFKEIWIDKWEFQSSIHPGWKWVAETQFVGIVKVSESILVAIRHCPWRYRVVNWIQEYFPALQNTVNSTNRCVCLFLASWPKRYWKIRADEAETHFLLNTLPGKPRDDETRVDPHAKGGLATTCHTWRGRSCWPAGNTLP